MKDEISRSEIINSLYSLAMAKNNDAVSLVFAPEQASERRLERLELEAISELHKLSNGTIDMKFVDRSKLFELLLKASEAEGGANESAELARAISGAAERLAAKAVEENEAK